MDLNGQNGMKGYRRFLGLLAVALLLSVGLQSVLGQVRMKDPKQAELLVLMQKLAPFYQNRWRAINEFAPSESGGDTMRWSKGRTVQEVSDLLRAELAQRATWATLTSLSEATYQARVQRLPFSIDTASTGYQALLLLLLQMADTYPSLEPLVESELESALAAEFFPEALQLLEWQLKKDSNLTEEEARLQKHRDAFGDSDERLVAEMLLLRIKYRKSVEPLETDLLKSKDPAMEKTWRTARQALEQEYEEVILPKVGQNRYEPRLTKIASSIFTNRITSIRQTALDVTTGEVTLQIKGILSSPSAVVRSKNWERISEATLSAGTTQVVKTFEVQEPTIIDEDVKDQLPAVGSYVYTGVKLPDFQQSTNQWVEWEKLELLFEVGEDAGYLYAISKADGIPVGNLSVSRLSERGDVVAHLRTNSDALLVLPREKEYYQVQVEHPGLSEARTFYLPPRREASGEAINRELFTFYTDRPLYQRGQQVEVGVVAHETQRGRHQVRKGAKEVARLVASREGGGDETIQIQRFKTNKNGVAELTFQLPEEEGLSNFRLKIGHHEHFIHVQDYKLSHLFITIDSIPSGYVVGQPFVLYGKTLDLNGLPAPATITMRYDDGARVETRSGVDGVFRFETPPLSGAGSNWRASYIELVATDALGNVATESIWRDKMKTNLPLNARSSINGLQIEKERFTLSLKSQPFQKLLLGDLSRYSVQAELIADTGKIIHLGELPMSGEKTFDLSHIPSGEYALRLYATDYYGAPVEDKVENLYLYSESDCTLNSDDLVWMAKLRDGSGILYGSAFDGTLTLILQGESDKAWQFVALPVQAHRLQRYAIPEGFEGVVHLYGYHHHLSDYESAVFGNSDSNGGKIEVGGLQELASEPLLPGTDVAHTLHLTDQSGAPMARRPVIVTIFDKAVSEASTASFWELLTPGAYFFDSAFGSPMPRIMSAEMSLKTTAVHEAVSDESAVEMMATNDSSLGILPLRSNFTETAFFSALLQTDSNGAVEINFRLPDTQTKYLLKLFTFGENLEEQRIVDQEFSVYSPLSVELSLPRYLVEGDTMMGFAQIRNASDSPRTTEFEIFLNGHSLTKGAVEISEHGVTAVPFTVETKNGNASELELSAQIRSGDIADGVKRVLPLLSGQSTYRVAKPLMLYGDERKITAELPKNELTTTALELDFYLSPLHVALSQIAQEYALRQPVEQLNFFPALHQFVIISELNHLLQTHPEIEQALRESAEAIAQVAEQEEKWQGELRRQAPPRELATFFTFISSPSERENLLQALEQKILSYAHPQGGFRYHQQVPSASPWLTTYLLMSLRGESQKHYSEGLKAEVERSFEFLAQQLEDPRSRYKSFLDFAILRARFGKKEEPMSEKIESGIKEEATRAKAEYQRLFNTSSLLRFAEFSRYYASPQEHAEVIQFVRDRSGYTYNDIEKANLALFLSEEPGAKIAPEVMRFLLQLKQGTLWESALSIRAITTLLREITPTQVSDRATLVVNGESHPLTPFEKATGRVVRTLKGVPETLEIEWIGVKSDYIFGGVSYDVQEPSAEVTPTGEQLTVEKEIFARHILEDGTSQLLPVTAEHPAIAGQQLIVRYLIEAKQDLSLIQLRDPRLAGAEPGYDFSGIGRADDFWYLYERRESYDRIFIDHLPRGRHLLELEATANVAGTFTYGPTTVESYYAPEYAGNSAGGRAVVASNLRAASHVIPMNDLNNNTIKEKDMATVTFQGNPLQTIGALPAKGVVAPDFVGVANDMTEHRLSDYRGKRVVLNIFPSVDTGVCAASVRQFNKLAAGLDNTIVLALSVDLPFALGRFCGAEGIDNVVTLSLFREPNFGKDYGVLITDSAMKGLLSRAVVVLDEEGKVNYTKQVAEVSNEPNYDAALEALKK